MKHGHQSPLCVVRVEIVEIQSSGRTNGRDSQRVLSDFEVDAESLAEAKEMSDSIADHLTAEYGVEFDDENGDD